MRVILTVVNALALIGASVDPTQDGATSAASAPQVPSPADLKKPVAEAMEDVGDDDQVPDGSQNQSGADSPPPLRPEALSAEDLKKSVADANKDAVAKYKKLLDDLAVPTKKIFKDAEKMLKGVDKLQSSSKKNEFMKETESFSNAMGALAADVPVMVYKKVAGDGILEEYRGRVRAFILNGALLVAHAEHSAKKLKEAAKHASKMVKLATDGGFIEELRKADPVLASFVEEFELVSRTYIERIENMFRGVRKEYETFLGESYSKIWDIKVQIKKTEAKLNAEKNENVKKVLEKELTYLKEALEEIPKLLRTGPESVSKYYKSTVKKYRKAIPEGSLTKNVNAALGIKEGKKNLGLIIGLSVAGVLIIGAAVYFFILKKH